ncbi:hypothetical protein [Salicibibacter cibi]|uniref:hypothetical protein n=1 Tax=Salicibibacter cibi TaxID=2743001 RepID=UPI001FE5C1D8|nr:hypothetical protein [Salicibibacter cibi]
MTKKQAWIIGRAVIMTGSIILLFWLAAYLFTLTYPFIIAAIIAWMLSPLLKYLKIKLNFPSSLASFVSLLVGISLLGGSSPGLRFFLFTVSANSLNNCRHGLNRVPSSYSKYLTKPFYLPGQK